MFGQTVSHYEILEKIGSGGMGVVYKAKDTRLERIVAVKFLAAHGVQDAASKKRLLREAQAASCLDHPNICTIHEIDEDEAGELFMVMAYYEGQTLETRLRGGPLEFQEATDIMRHILEGLGAAHKQRVVHRDMKPGNVMLTLQKEIKILDFGLARLLHDSGFSTETQAIRGTFPYMSPEQVRGLEVDSRADLWAAGIVLYEMLVGRPPFTGKSVGAVLHAITHEEPISPLAFSNHLPPAIEPVIRKALAHDRAYRYQNADQFLQDLGALTSTSAERPAPDVGAPGLFPPGQRSILVLPFVALESCSEGDYFSDGLTDELITDLSAIRALRVISRTSAMRLKGRARDLRKIAGKLRVQYVLEGTVWKRGDGLRLTARLIDATTDSLLWSERYTGSINDVFAIQEELSRKIVTALKVKLSSQEEQKLSERSIQDLRAYEYYLKAKHEILSYSKDSLERALEYLERGIRIVGRNPILTAAVGEVHWQFVNAGISVHPSHVEQAERCAQEVLSQDADSPHGNRLSGLVHITRGNTQQGVSFLKRALNAYPDDTDSLSWLIAVCGFSGKPFVAVPMAKRLLEIDPLTASYQCLPGLLALMAGEFGRAIAPFEKSLEMDPTNPMVRCVYGHILALNRQFESSARVIDLLHHDMPENFFAKLGQFYRHALAGDKRSALQCVTAELVSQAGADPHYCWNLAQCYALLQEKKDALDWLERAIRWGFINYPLLSRIDPFLENIRHESRFEELMENTRARWEAFEA
jgi:serine/threonine protein kinase/predicted Zn-dependent protease